MASSMSRITRKEMALKHCAKMEENLNEQLKLIQTETERQEWIGRCNECIRTFASYLKLGKLSIGKKQSLTALISRLKCLKLSCRTRLWVGGNLREEDKVLPLIWVDTESAFQHRVVTGVVANYNHIDPITFMRDAKRIALEKVYDAILNFDAVKVNCMFNGEFVIKKADKSAMVSVKSFGTRNHVLMASSDLSEWYDRNIAEVILKRLEEFQERDSGWALQRIINLAVNVNKCELLRGSCFSFRLPQELVNKKATVNVQSRDAHCFAWAVIASLYPASRNVSRTASYPDYRNVLDWTDITFPVALPQIDKFERRNNLSINVYAWKNGKTTPLRVSKNRGRNVDLLLLHDPQTLDNHFVCIRDISRLVAAEVSKHTHKVYVCRRCLHVFHSEAKLNAHATDCDELNEDCTFVLPTEENKWLKFTNFSRKEATPFIMYADFECILKNLPDKDSNTYAYAAHDAISIGYYLHCGYDSTLSRYESYRGEDCVAWFVKRLSELAMQLGPYFSKVVPMERLSLEQRNQFLNATHCHVCEKPLNEPGVRDHCHFTGRFRGAAHSNCNLNFKNSHFIPIVFHNLAGYDAHLIIKELVCGLAGKVEVLPITKENYISFTKYVKYDNNCDLKFRFIDSYKFLSSGLDKLASYLDRDKLKILKSQFDRLSREDFALLTRKGVFPYEYVNSAEKLNETRLPPHESFYSSLSETNISESEYEHARKVWNVFNIQNLGEYSDLYLKTDVLLLADIFENFRKSCLKEYKLDPAHYYTLPGFTWDAMLKCTQVELELLTDIDMVLFVERGVRGGLSQCSKRYAKANNKYMNAYDSRKPSTYLMYFDVNNLYGWAMSQYLPHSGFRWFNDDEITRFDVSIVSADSPEGYLLEVDLEYPREIHDVHADLPFCPERAKPPGEKKRDTKLLATVRDKERYVIHYLNLQQCLRHGLRLKKIYRILSFKQSAWLKSYIDLNTSRRTLAKNNFEKNLFKLMNNAVFGKTLENVRNHVDVKLLTKWEGRFGAAAMIARPNFHSRSIFSENFIAVEMRRLRVKLNKPLYVGMCILDISKTRLYDFHYTYMLNRYSLNKCNILYTDTDSLIYELECYDAYAIMKYDAIKWFDTDDYADDNPYHMPRVNKKIPGLMKDENNGKIMLEFVGLRSKMYALRIEGTDDVKKAKGVKNNVVKRTIQFDDYVSCLRELTDVRRRQNCIRSKMHKLYSVSEEKVALNPNDDKRYVMEDFMRTLPWGHYKI